MFDFVKRWFSHDETPDQQEAATPADSSNQVPYHPELIPTLVADHQALVELLGKVSGALGAGNIKPIPKLLQAFGMRLRAHLLKENVELYIYLARSFADDPDNQALIRDLKREMMHIGRSVNEFLEHYADHEWDDARRASFEEDFKQLTQVLGQRIQVEENDLYTLYMPPDSYGNREQ